MRLDWTNARSLLLLTLHLLPLVPLALGRWSTFAAALLVVAMPYVKDRRFSVLIEEIEETAPAGARPLSIEGQLDDLRRRRRRWRSLMLPWLRPAD